MKKTSNTTVGAVGVVVLVLFLTWCSNPFKHFNHTGGLAFYKQGLLPYASKEMDRADAPFTIYATLTDPAFANNRMAVIPVNADSSGLSFMVNGKHYSYVLQAGKQITTPFFVMRITPQPNSPLFAEHGIYYIMFLDRAEGGAL